jgi:hypothetical protein
VCNEEGILSRSKIFLRHRPHRQSKFTRNLGDFVYKFNDAILGGYSLSRLEVQGGRCGRDRRWAHLAAPCRVRQLTLIQII